MSRVVGIFTGKDLKMMESEGGSGYWVARTDRIKGSEYVFFMRNRREQWAAKDGLEHGQAFAIGKISGCIPSKKYEGRKLIQMSEYSLLPDSSEFKKAWKKLTGGQRYPVAYITTENLLEALDLDVATISWSVFNASPDAESILAETDEDEEVMTDEKELSEIIFEAKEMIALAADVDIDKISIQISF